MTRSDVKYSKTKLLVCLMKPFYSSLITPLYSVMESIPQNTTRKQGIRIITLPHYILLTIL